MSFDASSLQTKMRRQHTNELLDFEILYQHHLQVHLIKTGFRVELPI